MLKIGDYVRAVRKEEDRVLRTLNRETLVEGVIIELHPDRVVIESPSGEKYTCYPSPIIKEK